MVDEQLSVLNLLLRDRVRFTIDATDTGATNMDIDVESPTAKTACGSWSTATKTW
jgi:hypothetical protein